jgi:hypothetical protein
MTAHLDHPGLPKGTAVPVPVVAVTGERDHKSHRLPLCVPSVAEWCWFALQLFFVCAIQIGEDTLRGNFFPVSHVEAEGNAHRLIDLEMRLHIFVEPAWQSAARNKHAFHGLISGVSLVHGADIAYGVLHLAVPGVLAAWVYITRRRRFGELRNTFLWTNILALLGYEFFPTAPPRLTGHIMVAGQPYHFLDTMHNVIGDGRMHGVPLAYNAYSAMPSVHIAWALIVAITLLRLQRRPALHLAAGLYPCLMLAAVVITANHWLLDAAGAALDVAAAYAVAVTWEAYK